MGILHVKWITGEVKAIRFRNLRAARVAAYWMRTGVVYAFATRM